MKVCGLVAEGTRRYRGIRTAQRDALAASSLPLPGNNAWRASYTWDNVFRTGLHEVSNPGLMGLPGKDLPRRLAVRAVVERQDVWLPDPDELREAHDRMEALRRQPDDPASAPKQAEPSTDLDPAAVAYLDAHTSNNAPLTRSNR